MDRIPTNPDFSHLRWKESKTLTLSNGLICFAKSEAVLYLGPREATTAGGEGQEAAPDWTDSTALRITTSPPMLPSSFLFPNILQILLTPRYSVLQTLILYPDTCVLRCGKRATRSQLFPQTRRGGRGQRNSPMPASMHFASPAEASQIGAPIRPILGLGVPLRQQ